MGIQGSVFSKAIEIINKMITWKLEDEEEFDEDNLKKFHYRKCKKYLGFSSSMASTGCRDIIKYICEHRMVDVIVTTTGGVEEDLIKCFGDYYIGNFNDIENGDLIKEGLERQGNVLVPKGIQQKFEEWILKIFKEIHAEQDHEKFKYASPLSIIKKLGEKIGDEKSILYQCWKNDIPVFCPSFTDGLIGEILYRYNKQHPGFVIDTANDVMLMNNSTLFTTKTGAIILGGGIIKHHILNANLFRNGANYSVYINTGAEFEASDSGAKPTEALSWGKLRLDCEYAKVYSEVSLILPLLVAATFKKHEKIADRVEEWKKFKKEFLEEGEVFV